jgi:hypothetical protein
MTKPTDVSGNTSGANLIYGPYFQGQAPTNPFNNSYTLVAVASAGIKPTGPVADGAGWQYDATTGDFYPNLETTLWDYTLDKPK